MIYPYRRVDQAPASSSCFAGSAYSALTLRRLASRWGMPLSGSRQEGNQRFDMNSLTPQSDFTLSFMNGRRRREYLTLRYDKGWLIFKQFSCALVLLIECVSAGKALAVFKRQP